MKNNTIVTDHLNKANKEKKAAYDKAYRESHKAEFAAYHKAYYEANKEKIAAQKKAFREANKEKFAAQRKACDMGKATVTDHLGNEYKSLTAMCNAYDVPRTTYIRRLERGWSQEAALTTPSGNTVPTSYVRVSTEERIANEKAKEKAYRESHKKEKAAYREANKEKIAAQKKAYYEANKEKIAARNKAYREANKEKIAAYQKAYREANRKAAAAN